MNSISTKKSRTWLWIAAAVLVAAVGVGIKAFYFGFFLSESDHPTRPYKIVISKIPSLLDWQTGTPGDSGNSHVWVRLYDTDGNKLHEIRTTLNDLSTKMWGGDSVVVTSDIVWPLPDESKEAHKTPSP